MVKDFRKSVDEAISKIKSLEQFRESDNMVDYVFKIGREMFDKPLDIRSVAWLIDTGGRLTGVYAYLGNKASRARAIRDIYEQKIDEETAKITIEAYRDADSKIMLSKAIAKKQVAELREFLVIAEQEKNNWENLLAATEKLISFAQSAIKVKESERFRSNQMSDGQHQ